MVATFLRGRSMTIRVGDSKSKLRPVPGGSPQGTLLGNFLFIITTDYLDLTDDIPAAINSTPPGANITNPDEEYYQHGGVSPSINISLPTTPDYLNASDHGASPTTTETTDLTAAMDPMMITFEDDTPRPTKWREEPMECYKYVDDFLGVEKLFTGSGLYTYSQQ